MRRKGVLKKRLGGLITEREARDIVGRGRSWFWRQRKSGRLRPTVIGGRVFYQAGHLLSLLDSGRRTAWERKPPRHGEEAETVTEDKG